MSAFRPYTDDAVMRSKGSVAMLSVDEAFEQTDLPPEKAGTAMDRRDMARMGKSQEFKVRG